jgi:hypothetical protein
MARKSPRPPRTGALASTLPFDPAEMMAMRVTPAQLAEMCNVRRQSVTKWIKKGWIVVGPDGLVDPKVAIRGYLDCVNPAKMRVRVLKDATASIPELRARIQSLETEVAAAMQAGENRCTDEFARRICAFCCALHERFEEFRAAYDAGTGTEWLDLLEGRVIWGLDEEAAEAVAADPGDSRETTPEETEK